MLWNSTGLGTALLQSSIYLIMTFMLHSSLLTFSSDCEWKAQAGNVCIASFDWSCSGICKSVEKIKGVHERCGEGDGAMWSALL